MSQQQAPAPPEPGTPSPTGPAPRGRPIVERLGMAAIALVLGGLFAVVAVAAIGAGELFLGVMGVIGTLMVLWVGALTLLRG